MLLPQIPDQFKEEIAAEIGFNIGIVSAKIGSKVATLESRVARLQVVERYIRKDESIGTPSAPLRWIEAKTSATAVDVGEGALLYLADAPSWRLALAGSAKHLAGTAKPDSVDIPFSFLPAIASQLSFLDRQTPRILNDIPERLPPSKLAGAVSEGIDAWFEAIDWCFQTKPKTLQQIGFLAKCLAVGVAGDRKITMASPLYVELLG
jgi:hypothetical protein